MKMRLYDKKITVLVLSLGLVAGVFSGCGSSSVSKADYVDALMNVAYFSDDVDGKILDMSDEDIDKAREGCADKEAQFLEAYFNMEDVSEDTHSTFEEIAGKLSAAVKYETEEGEGDKVIVKITPLVVYSDELQEFVDDFNVKKFVDADESCTEEKFVDGVAGYLEAAAENAEYADEVKVEVTVKKESGKYEISDEDLAAIDKAVFVYE